MSAITASSILETSGKCCPMPIVETNRAMKELGLGDTHAGLTRQGVKPSFVIIYIGPTVRFLTTAPDGELELEQGDALKAIADRVPVRARA